MFISCSQEEDPPQMLFLVSKSTLITHNTQLATNKVEFRNGIGIDSILNEKKTRLQDYNIYMYNA